MVIDGLAKPARPATSVKDLSDQALHNKNEEFLVHEQVTFSFYWVKPSQTGLRLR